MMLCCWFLQGGEQRSQMFPRPHREDRVRSLRHGRRRRVQTQLHPASRRPVSGHRHHQVYARATLRPRLRVVQRHQEASTIALCWSVAGRCTTVDLGFRVVLGGGVALARYFADNVVAIGVQGTESSYT